MKKQSSELLQENKVCSIFWTCITATNNYEIILLGNVIKVHNDILLYYICFLSQMNAFTISIHFYSVCYVKYDPITLSKYLFFNSSLTIHITNLEKWRQPGGQGPHIPTVGHHDGRREPTFVLVTSPYAHT